ncbi:hypothetical protein ACET94_16740 [Aeromonas veronii]
MFNNAVKLMVKLGAAGAFMFGAPAFAAGGLDAGTNAMSDIKIWLYSFLAVVAVLILLYNITMALFERKTWGDVGMALVYVTAAGGSVLAGEWAWRVFL